jgi:hypothetical protein
MQVKTIFFAEFLDLMETIKAFSNGVTAKRSTLKF